MRTVGDIVAVMKTKVDDSVRIGFRVSGELLAVIDAEATAMTKRVPGHEFTRSDAARAMLIRGSQTVTLEPVATKEFLCVRVGCGHSLERHWKRPGAITIQGQPNRGCNIPGCDCLEYAS